MKNIKVVTYDRVLRAYKLWLYFVSNPVFTDYTRNCSNLAYKEFLKLRRDYDRWSDEPFRP